MVDRSFFDGGPASDGTVVLDAGPAGARRTTPIELPGLRIVTRIGAGPVTGDVPFTHGLHLSGQTRASLDNLKPSRARGNVRRTLPRAELEERLAPHDDRQRARRRPASSATRRASLRPSWTPRSRPARWT